MKRRRAPLQLPPREGVNKCNGCRRRKWELGYWLLGDPLPNLVPTVDKSPQSIRFQRSIAHNGEEKDKAIDDFTVSEAEIQDLQENLEDTATTIVTDGATGKNDDKMAAVPRSSYTRSAVARELFPNLCQKDAGQRVARDIMGNPNLREIMFRLGYIPNKVGYTPEQIAVLKKFYNK